MCISGYKMLMCITDTVYKNWCTFELMMPLETGSGLPAGTGGLGMYWVSITWSLSASSSRKGWVSGVGLPRIGDVSSFSVENFSCTKVHKQLTAFVIY